MTRPAKAESAVLEEYVEDAARQRLRLLGWQDDRRFAESGGKIIYSIDTNILKLFLDPVGVAVPHRDSGKDPRPGYTQIFRDDPPELSIALGRAIAEFILFQSGKRSPVLMLPPLEREVGRMFHAIVLNAHQEHHDAVNELRRLRENLNVFVDRVQSEPDDAGRVDFFIDAMPKLHEFLFGYSGPSAELARFPIFLEKSQLTDLDRFLSVSRGVDADVAENLHRPNTVRDWIDFSYLRGKWKERLGPLKSRRMARQNIETDCHVLARVELFNRTLKPHNVRVVHVTGDQAILQAASAYQPTVTGPSFAALYLRDPRSFLAEPSVLFTDHETTPRNSQELIDWLDVFLAEFTNNEAMSSTELLMFLGQKPEKRHSTIQQILERDPTAGRVFADRWKRFCGQITLDHILTVLNSRSSHAKQYLSILPNWMEKERHPEFREAAREFRREVRDLKEILDALESLVVERVMETWRDCFAAATSTGFSLLLFGSGNARPARGPLPITFAKFHAASDFFTKMLRGGHDDRYREMIEALEEEDDTGYLFYLAFGALFGAQGKWHVVHILADRALDIIKTESHGRVPEQISGREAYYLRAAARRLTARDHDDFDEAGVDLKHARDALERSRDNDPSHPITPLRFDAEQVALDLSRHLFNMFSKGIDEQDPAQEVFCPLQDRIGSLLGRVDKELPQISIRERVRRALLVNHLTCLIMGARTPLGAVRHVEIREQDRVVFNDLSRRMTDQDDAQIQQSYLHRTVLLAARTLFEPARSKAEFRARLAKLERHFDNDTIAENLVTTYDRCRFEFMRNFAMRTLGEGFRNERRSIRP